MKPYSVSVPVINECITDENRDILLDMLLKAEVQQVVLSFHGVYACDVELLKKNAAFFKDNGLEVALWVGHTIGHGGDEFAFTEKDLPYQHLVNRAGTERKSTFCPRISRRNKPRIIF